MAKRKKATADKTNLLKSGMSFISKTNRYIDLWILIPILILMALGSMMVFSSSAAMTTGSALSFFLKQVVFDIVGLGILFFVFHLKIKWTSSKIVRWIRIGLIGSVLVMFATKLVGPTINGAKGWIFLGPISIQPVEIFKIMLIITLAYKFSGLFPPAQRRFKTNGKRGFPWRLFEWSFIVFGLVLELVMPDLGGLFILIMIGFVVALAPKINRFWAIVTALGSIGFYQVAVNYLIPFMSDHMGINNYSFARIIVFINPWPYATSSGLQLINSWYAISNGGIMGRGLGNSLQKLGNLPEPNTDFIMAVMAEELGVVGVMFTLLLTMIIIYRLILWGLRSQIVFYRLILYGIATYLFMQIFVNFGGVIGVLPITGVTFPFISYGGSSVLSLSIALGLALNVIKQVKSQQKLNEK